MPEPSNPQPNHLSHPNLNQRKIQSPNSQKQNLLAGINASFLNYNNQQPQQTQIFALIQEDFLSNSPTTALTSWIKSNQNLFRGINRLTSTHHDIADMLNGLATKGQQAAQQKTLSPTTYTTFSTLASHIAKPSSHITSAIGLQPNISKIVERIKLPISTPPLNISPITISNTIPYMVSAEDILIKRHTEMWSDPLHEAVEYITTSLPTLLNNNQVANQVQYIWRQLGGNEISIDIDPSNWDTDTITEDIFETTQQIANNLGKNDELSLKAAQIFVGPAIKQMSPKEAGAALVAVAIYLTESIDQLLKMTNPTFPLMIITLFGLALFFQGDKLDEKLEQRRRDRVNEVLESWGH